MASISSSTARVGIHSGEEVKLLVRLHWRNCAEYVPQGEEPVLTLRQSAQVVHPALAASARKTRLESGHRSKDFLVVDPVLLHVIGRHDASIVLKESFTLYTHFKPITR
jgi:hypothetical protein